MRRREFVTASALVASNLLVRSVFAQDQGPRAAVVIGVDKCGNLPILSAAASSAKLVADWLKSEGFEVKLFVDDDKPVRSSDIFDAIAEFVGRGTLSQLVVYFSGHGFLNGFSEYWMFSGAPDNPNEAASLIESTALAKESGITNVVFISDACRSTPDSLGTSRVRGSLIFPNGDASQVRADVDKFLAALPGKPALELPVADSTGRFEGIYTSCFLDAFKKPDASMVRTLENGSRVVPNRNLKAYLTREVQKRAQAKSIKLNQIPDADVVSDDTAYIGKVAPETVVAPPPVADSQATIFDVASRELARDGANISLLGPNDALPESEINRVALSSGFSAIKASILAAPDITQQVPVNTGFVVSGTNVELVTTNPMHGAEIVSRERSTTIQISIRDGKACSVAIRFEDGSGTVLAALNEFVGSVEVAGGGVSNVNYDPSRNNWRFSDYEFERPRLASLRATVAASARYGVLRIEGDKDTRAKGASSFADRIRVLKGIDPTLGIYAAYAYADADLVDQVRSVRSYMRDDLNVDIFDVAMLAGELSGRSIGGDDGAVPFCPMLNQGWSFLRVKDVRLPDSVAETRDYLRPALWTTFEPKGMNIVIEALRSGRLR